MRKKEIKDFFIKEIKKIFVKKEIKDLKISNYNGFKYQRVTRKEENKLCVNIPLMYL